MGQTTLRTMQGDGSGSFYEVVGDSPCSVEVTRNAKGDYQWSIKAYCGQKAYEMAEAVDIVKDVDSQLRRLFPGVGDGAK